MQPGAENAFRDSAPAQPRDAITQVYSSPEQSELDLKFRPGGQVFFLLIWLTGWTAACIFVPYTAITQARWEIFAWVIPAWIGEVVVLTYLLKMLTGRERLRVNSAGVEYEYSWKLGRSTRVIPFAQLRKIDIAEGVINKSTAYGLRLGTDDEPVVFALTASGPALRLEEARWLRHELLLAVGMHGGDAVFERLLASDTPIDQAGDPIRVITQRGDSKVERVVSLQPLGAMEVDIQQNDLRLRRPAVFGLFSLILFTCFTIFWDWIVGSFYTGFLFSSSKPGPDLCFILFVLPHTAVGLYLIAQCAAILLAPFRDQVWIFSPDQLVMSHRLLGFALYSKQIAREKIQRVVREPAKPGKREFIFEKDERKLRTEQQTLRDLNMWQISLYATASDPLMVITLLSEEESSRVEKAIHQRFPDWNAEPVQGKVSPYR